MEKLYIKPTQTSLEVSLDQKTGQFSFTGRARPEDSAAFFNPIIAWLEDYGTNPAEQTVCTFKLEYFNSAARKCMTDVFSILDFLHKSGKKAKVIWQYDENDEGMKETGEEYKELFSMPFELESY